MTELLLFCLCVSLACTVIHISVTWDEMILHWSEKYLAALPVWFRKPLYECLVCMCSIWTIFFWTLYIRPIGIDLLFAILITGGLNAIICIALDKTDYGC